MAQTMTTQIITLDEKRNVTLTCYLQPAGGAFDYVTKRPGILILPGGAYRYCSDRESDPVAFAYLKAGYQVFILRYSVAQFCGWPAPLMDYDQAMGMIREHAEEWNLYADKIAVLGFSAGGHLAAAAATMSVQRPNAALLGYAVTGNDVKGCSPTAPDCVPMVDDKTCPCFVFAARDDNVVPVMNSIRFLEALTEKGIAYESHIYARGGHGFSTAEQVIQNPNTAMSERVPNWVSDSIGWLKEVFGTYDGEGGMTDPLVKAHINGDYEAYLSADCTVAKLLSVPASRAILEPLLTSMQAGGSSANATAGSTDSKAAGSEFDTSKGAQEDSMVAGVDAQTAQSMVLPMKLNDLLRFAGAPEEAVAKLDAALRQIPNQEA